LKGALLMGKKNVNWNPRDYGTLEELAAEVDRFEAAFTAGTLRTTGNWSAGQIMQHTGNLMGYTIDGFDASAPLPIRLFGMLIFKPMLGRSHMRPGIKLPKGARSLLPDDEVSFEDGIGVMRNSLARIQGGERMTQRSPVLGKMKHEQWVLLHLDHCRLHFGFIQLDHPAG
jgi:hypothetical protein